ncbi:MAG: InlB B-repeat-containing protein [Oscillospiraceae bacterium]|nr:InlB B-repeat-containing protein [Oscillospiraceae bacterium]
MTHTTCRLAIKRALPLFIITCLLIGGLPMSDFTETVPIASASGGTVDVYPFHYDQLSSEHEFTAMSVKVEDQDVRLYNTPVNVRRNWTDTMPMPDTFLRDAAIAMFSMTGTVTVEVTYPAGVSDAIVRPYRADIECEINGNTVTFDLQEPGQYSLEFNGDPEVDNLMIFANPPQPLQPAGTTENLSGWQTSSTADVIVVDGYVDIGQEYLELAYSQTVYFKPGAVLRGGIKMNRDTTVLGCGVITGDGFGIGRLGPITAEQERIDWAPGSPYWSTNAALREYDGVSTPLENLTVKDVAILDPNRWVVEFLGCDGVALDNIKVISARHNGDGITIQSTRNMTIDNSFIRSWDDSIVLKNYTDISCENIEVKNCVIWTDLAQSMEIGFETNKGGGSRAREGNLPKNPDPYIRNILFEDIDIIHNFHKPVISINNADACRVYNITYKNIYVDNAQMGMPGKFSEGGGIPYLLNFCNGTSEDMGGANWSSNHTGYREIKNITVDGVWVIGGNRNSCQLRLINVNRPESVMENITLKNILWGKEKSPVLFNFAPINVFSSPQGLLHSAITQIHDTDIYIPPTATPRPPDPPTPTPVPTEKPIITPSPTPSPNITVSLDAAAKKHGSVTVVRENGIVIITAKAKKGYTFAGWYENGKKIQGADAKYILEDIGTRRITPKFNARAYSITWRLNKGKLNKKSRPSKYTFGKGLKLRRPTRRGYTFTGWYSDKKLKKKVKGITKKQTGNITLRAGWKAKAVKKVQSKASSAVRGTVTTPRSSPLRFRETPRGRILGRYPNGTELAVLGVSGNWYQVRHGNKTGYVYKQYIKIT